MKKSLKDAPVMKDLQNLKNKEQSELGIQDFFTSRDKIKRGIIGLVEDSSQVLSEEVNVKQDLYDKSMTVESLPSHVVPIFGGVFTTARRNKITNDSGLYLPTATYGKGSDTDMDVDFSDKQIVLACGSHAQQVAPGMEITLNMDNFKKRLEGNMKEKVNKEFEYKLPIEIINGVEYLYITERDVKYISNTNEIIINKPKLNGK